jgi:anti-anti-sigma factor
MITKEIIDDVLIEKIDLKRATIKEAEECKRIIMKDIKEGWTRIIINLHVCESMDSTFLGTLVLIAKKAGKLKGALKLVAPSSVKQTIFDTTGASHVLPIFQKINDAVLSFKTN